MCGRTARTVRCGGGWKRSDLATVTAVKRPAGESRGKVTAGPNVRQRHRASPRPYIGVDGWRWLIVRAAFWTRILVLGYDGGPAGGPGGRGFHGPRGCPSLVAGMGSCWSGGLRERVDALPGGRDRLGPRPGGLDFQAAPPAAADQPGGGVQDAVAQRLGLGFGQVAVQGQQLEPGQQDRPRSWRRSATPA